MHALLVTFKPDGTRKDFAIKPDRRYTIGRADTCDLRIGLSAVSREHAAIFFDEEEDELVIEDLGSRNGTYVNNEKVERVELCPGDVIAIGPVPLQVVIDGHPAEVEPIKIEAGAVGPEDEDAAGDQSTATGEEPSPAPAPKPTPVNAGAKTDEGTKDEKDSNIDSFFGFDLDDDDI
ncbi:MAG: FHA domain-containing protein [Phycisphaerales bacterium]